MNHGWESFVAGRFVKVVCGCAGGHLACCEKGVMESKGQSKLLVVDDDRKLAGLIRDYLTPMGYEVGK